MEEEKEVVEQNNEQPKVEKEIKMSEKFLFLLFAIASLFIVVLTSILLRFGVYHNVIHGIVCIFAFVLPIVGAILAYLKDKKPSFEVYANLIALALALLVL